MARTKTTRRTYKLGNRQHTENVARDAGSLLPEEPVQDIATKSSDHTEAELEDLPNVILHSPTVNRQVDTIQSKEYVSDSANTNAVSSKPQDNCLDMSRQQENGFVKLPTLQKNLDMSTTPQENGSVVSPRPHKKRLAMDMNDDTLQLASPVVGCGQGSIPISQHQTADIETHVSRDSPLNLVWDASTKENCQPQVNAPDFRPVTPELRPIPVDEIFSPTIQKEFRATYRALFPNGPPPPPPVRPVRRPKKGDKPYIVGCTERSRVPSPKSLRVFQGDKYGITDNSNCLEDEEQCLPAKRARRGPNGSGSLSKSRFNPHCNEIAERLKLHEKIDRLLGRTPKEEPISYITKPRSFSPLPSTSTDNETIMKNDKHFSESLNCDNFDLDDDEELPEILWDASSSYKKENSRKDSPVDIAKVKNEGNNNDTDNVLTEIYEDRNNNNDNYIIPIDDDFCEIEFDKYMPKEKILDYSDVEDFKPKRKPEVVDGNEVISKLCPTSTDVICVEDVNQGTVGNENVNPVSQTSVNSATTVLRASNKIATEPKQSDQVIEVPDVSEPINMSFQASTSRIPAWSEDVQFVSEVKTSGPPRDEHIANVSDVQIVQGPSCSQNSIRLPPDFGLQSLQLLLDLSESYARRKFRSQRKKSKRQRLKENSGVPVVNNENTAPSVNQAQPALANPPSSSQPAASTSPGSKRLGECPICLEILPTGSIASTICGHVFCLECIKQSLKTTGRRCPTCRKQLRGVGYHQVFL